MKALKIIIMLILLVLTSVTSEGAVSGDMSEYVRKDVYEVQMQNLNGNMERILQKLDSIESKVNNMSDRITELSARVDGLDARMGDLRNDIYLGLVILGIIVGVPSVQKWYESLKASRPSVTLEEVKRLIEENNAELLKSLKS